MTWMYPVGDCQTHVIAWEDPFPPALVDACTRCKCPAIGETDVMRTLFKFVIRGSKGQEVNASNLARDMPWEKRALDEGDRGGEGAESGKTWARLPWPQKNPSAPPAYD